MKNINVWNKLKDAIKKLFFFDEPTDVNAYHVLSNALDKLLDNYDTKLFEEYERTREITDSDWNFADIKESDASIEAAMNGEAQPKFSLSDKPFYSNAEKAVDNIKQEKATPEQWLKMIEKNGGLKAGEDKWMGLSEWLKGSDKKTFTKQEVLDFIRENQIQIEETNYKEYFNVDENPQMKKFRTEFDDIVRNLEDEKEAVEEEANAFNDEMYRKYGEGWANDPDRLSKEDQRRNDDMIERWDKLNDEDLRELAFREMVDKYGDDFETAFEYNYGNGKLEPQMDMYGDDISDAAKYFLQFDEQPINSTRLEYTTKGLDNKKEIALTVPTVESWNESDNIHFGDAGEGRAVAWVRFGETEGVPNGVDADRYHDYSRKMKEAISRRDEMVEQLKRYKGGMLTETQKRLEEEAYIQQLRERYKDVEDVKPSRVLVIDEIQSNRHQEGRENGYIDNRPVKAKERRVAEAKTAYEEAVKAVDEYVKSLPNIIATAEEEIKLNELKATRDEAYNKWRSAQLEPIPENNAKGIPDAPFEKNWHELAMKRMLRYAAENGYDKVAWTKGAQQAERYGIGTVIEKISVFPDNEFGGRQVMLREKNNDIIDLDVDKNGVIENGRFRGAQLSEVVGKDLAAKILDATKNEVYEGEELRIGSEGMKGFYDQMLPRFMDKYGKKWGVKTGEIELPNVEEAGRKMWSVDVTPEMKESVMQGQPMFSLVDKNNREAEGYTGSDPMKAIEESARLFRESRSDDATRREIGEKTVKNTFIDSQKEQGIPSNRAEALALFPDEGGLLFPNEDQGTSFKVSRSTVKHSALHDEKHVYQAFGKIKEIVNKAVKIGEIPVSEEKKKSTNSVSIFYTPINIDGTQYSARLLVRELKDRKGAVVEDLSLYNLGMHKEKTPSNTGLNSPETGLGSYSEDVKGDLNANNGASVSSKSPFSGYKVKDLIHNTQEKDKELIGLNKNYETYFRNGSAEERQPVENRAVVEGHVTTLKSELGENVQMANSVDEINNEKVRKKIESGEKVMGWYDEKDNSVHLYMPNIPNSYEAEKTVWHETVGHKGMVELLGEEGYKRYMMKLWLDDSNKELTEFVKERLPKNGFNPYEAINEWYAEQVEKLRR